MAASTSESAPLNISRPVRNQRAASYGPEVTSYFDILPKRDSPVSSRLPSTPVDQSPGSLARPSPTRRPHFKFHSDYEGLHRRMHDSTIEEYGSHETPSPGTQHSIALPTPSSKIPSDHSREVSLHQSSLQSSESSDRSAQGPRSSTARNTYSPPRPKIGHIWGRSHPATGRWDRSHDAHENTPRRFSALSESVTNVGDVIVVRTDQSPIAPPVSKSVSASRKSLSSSIKVETEFNERTATPSVSQQFRALSVPVQKSDDKTQPTSQSYQHSSASSSRKSSLSPKQILTVPLRLLNLKKLGKQSNLSLAVPMPSLPLLKEPSRMAAHVTELKRNRTAEALQRATSILQEAKQLTLLTRPPTQLMKPSTWRSWSDISAIHRTKSDTTTPHAFTAGLSPQSITGPVRPVFGKVNPRWYSSSIRELYMGAVPTTTPNEGATYKVKRSPSAETEEFLKVDISIRGGTSYLPSEARRIHTPPLPEEGIDGRWRGFFFDYNAPRRTSRLPSPVVQAEDESDIVTPVVTPPPDQVQEFLSCRSPLPERA